MYVGGGEMLGGNSAFAHIGHYDEIDGEIIADVGIHRHNPDLSYKSLLGADDATVQIVGKAHGDAWHFHGGSPQLPGAPFRSVMTALGDEIGPLPGPDAVGAGGIINGLYSVHMQALDGINVGLTGIMLLYDGRILGGDAFFYYLGTYSSINGRWKGSFLNQEHTPAKSEHPLFGGLEVGVGFSGTCDDKGATLEATALVGKRSIRLMAKLTLMRQGSLST
ncbi:MAG: hypothetical protein JWR73_1544 [Tardiphaga sp.]|nr:hypothetical protein [Tardiphaga sp.]